MRLLFPRLHDADNCSVHLVLPILLNEFARGLVALLLRQREVCMTRDGSHNEGGTTHRFLGLNAVDLDAEQLGLEVVVHSEHVTVLNILALHTRTIRAVERQAQLIPQTSTPRTMGSFFNTRTFPHASDCSVRFNSACSANQKTAVDLACGPHATRRNSSELIIIIVPMFVAPAISVYTHESAATLGAG